VCLLKKDQKHFFPHLNRFFLLSVGNLEGIKEALAKFKSSMEEKKDFIDKRIVASLITTYIQKSEKREEVLNLMANMLNFTDEQKAAVTDKYSLPLSHPLRSV